VLLDGFFHSLGHGVGLEVHEEPHHGPGEGTLVAGDVIAVEPGCYRQGFGGTRLEDLILVTDSGAANFNSYPYELEP
jgi:Xaa-Pro aminopeptidase